MTSARTTNPPLMPSTSASPASTASVAATGPVLHFSPPCSRPNTPPPMHATTTGGLSVRSPRPSPACSPASTPLMVRLSPPIHHPSSSLSLSSSSPSSLGMAAAAATSARPPKCAPVRNHRFRATTPPPISLALAPVSPPAIDIAPLPLTISTANVARMSLLSPAPTSPPYSCCHNAGTLVGNESEADHRASSVALARPMLPPSPPSPNDADEGFGGYHHHHQRPRHRLVNGPVLDYGTGSSMDLDKTTDMDDDDETSYEEEEEDAETVGQTAWAAPAAAAYAPRASTPNGPLPSPRRARAPVRDRFIQSRARDATPTRPASLYPPSSPFPDPALTTAGDPSATFFSRVIHSQLMSDPDLLRDPTDAPHTPPRAAPIRRSPPPLERLSTAIPPPRTAQSRNGGNSTETESAQPPPFAMPTSLPATSPPRRIDSARPTDSPPRTPAVSAVLPMPPSSSTVAAAASRRTLAHRVPPRTPAAPTGASTILAINPFAARGRGPITPTVAARIAAHQRQGDAVRRRLDMISGVPTRVLDAPGICDDYYLNLLDWSSRGIIAVALGASVYLWSSQTAAVSRILDLEPEGDTVTSLKWAGRGHYLAIGTAAGLVHLIDSSTGRRVRTFRQNTTPLSRVGVLAWCGDQIYAGTKDARIEQWDHRAPDRPAAVLAAHRVEVCGLQWSPDLAMLASGGNDNRAYIWDPRKSTTSNAVGPVTASPLYVLAEHKAAVKAMAWSPHHSGVLVTGGGTADQTIRVWNLRASQPLQQQNPSSGSSQQQPIALRSVHTVHTGSQVCNLLWSRTSKTEIVSTHGYSEHAISLWEYDPASPGNMAAAAAAAGERAMHGQQYQQQQQQRRRATLPRLGIPTLSTLNSSTPTGGMVIAQPDGSPEMVGCPPRQLTSVTGHSSRVLYASLSPDGTCLATAAGDETLRIWRMFPAASSSDSIAAAAATPVASSVVAEWGSASRRSGPAPLLR